MVRAARVFFSLLTRHEEGEEVKFMDWVQAEQEIRKVVPHKQANANPCRKNYEGNYSLPDCRLRLIRSRASDESARWGEGWSSSDACSLAAALRNLICLP
jgi:hypothetical protein